MTKPDFQAMDLRELRAYVLSHRQDDEAFYIFVDRQKAAHPQRVQYPLPQTQEDFEAMRRIVRERIRQIRPHHDA
ncbi:MAG: hypothetical protein VKK04_14275 [Synechococcales bacterium]|nr:hypothetical protein [Synechococcales bacterium]